jgi:hypothetical protein
MRARPARRAFSRARTHSGGFLLRTRFSRRETTPVQRAVEMQALTVGASLRPVLPALPLADLLPVRGVPRSTSLVLVLAMLRVVSLPLGLCLLRIARTSLSRVGRVRLTTLRAAAPAVRVAGSRSVLHHSAHPTESHSAQATCSLDKRHVR